MTDSEPREVRDLIARSNRIGSDPRNTNYGGGNTSSKGTAIDPATGTAVDVLWVKGSGGVRMAARITAATIAYLRMREKVFGDTIPAAARIHISSGTSNTSANARIKRRTTVK